MTLDTQNNGINKPCAQRKIKAQDRSDLIRHNEDASARCEPNGDRIGNEVDQQSQARQTEGKAQRTGEDRKHASGGNKLRRAGRGERQDDREGEQGCSIRRTGVQVARRSPERAND
jgi:hypothetical protein